MFVVNNDPHRARYAPVWVVIYKGIEKPMITPHILVACAFCTG
jgi:hypothetical protein